VCKRSTTVDIEYSMHDQLCDVISYCLAVAAYTLGKISVQSKIVTEKSKKIRKIDYGIFSRIFIKKKVGYGLEIVAC